MKYISILLFLCFAGVYPQDSMISEIKVEYDVVELSGNKTREIKAILYFNHSNSVFIYKNGAAREEISSSQENSVNNYNLNIKVVHIDTLENSIYYDIHRNSFVRTALDFNTNKKVYIKGPIKELRWNITSEIKKINTLECTKATLKYQDENYVAWFSTAIPTSFGPYDFGQLLGLILELYSEDRRLYITATNIKYPHKQTVELPGPEIAYITKSDYEALTKKYLDSINTATKDRVTRILTKNQRGVKISNIKVETTKNNKN